MEIEDLNPLKDWDGKKLRLRLKKLKKGEEELLLIHFNKQRIKSFKELINEYSNT